MLASYKYAYLITNFFFLAVWFLIFWKVKHLRRPMLIMSLITASFGPISELWFLLIFFVVVGLSMIILNNFLGLNSIFASSIGMIMVAAIMLYLRPDLITNALGSAFLVAGIMFVIYFLGQEFFPGAHAWMLRIWKLSETSQGVIIFKHIPWTEMLWGLSWGLVWGPMYEFLVGARIITLKRR